MFRIPVKGIERAFRGWPSREKMSGKKGFERAMVAERITSYEEERLERGCLDVLDGIKVPGTGVPSFQQAYQFLLALSEEIHQMKKRLLSGDPVALGYVEVLTRAMR